MNRRTLSKESKIQTRPFDAARRGDAFGGWKGEKKRGSRSVDAGTGGRNKRYGSFAPFPFSVSTEVTAQCSVDSRLDSLPTCNGQAAPWRLLSKGPLSLSPARMRALVGRRASHPCRRPWLRLRESNTSWLRANVGFPRRVEQMQAFVQWHVISRTLPGLRSTEVAFRRVLFLLLLGRGGEKPAAGANRKPADVSSQL